MLADRSSEDAGCPSQSGPAPVEAEVMQWHPLHEYLALFVGVQHTMYAWVTPSTGDKPLCASVLLDVTSGEKSKSESQSGVKMLRMGFFCVALQVTSPSYRLDLFSNLWRCCSRWRTTTT